MKKIYLAGGCFWGTEKYLQSIKGVVNTSVGYANGNTQKPTYEEVCTGETGFTETVEVEYIAEEVNIDKLLNLYYDAIDPLSVNKQGGDEGTQYRTGIYYTDDIEKEIITNSLNELQKKYKKPIAIEFSKLKNYYEAEEYHQKYLDKNPTGYCHIGKDMFDKAEQSNR